MLLPDGDEVEAIAPSHLSPMGFSGNCLPKCCDTQTPTHVTGPSCKLSNIPSWRPMIFANSCWKRPAMWPRGHISNRMRSASFGLRLLRQCERPCCTLAVVGGCTVLFMVGAILAYDPARGFLARRGEPGGGT